jgi:hypothetical protein
MRRIASLIIAFWLAFSGMASGFCYLALFGVEEKGWELLAAGFVFAVGAAWLYSEVTATAPDEDSSWRQVISPNIGSASPSSAGPAFAKQFGVARVPSSGSRGNEAGPVHPMRLLILAV